MKKKNYLKGNIICALPQLKDLFFTKSLIYLTHHNDDGAIGIVLNYRIMNVSGNDLFEKLNIVSEDRNRQFSLHIGGPLSQKNGFILHSKEYKKKDTIKISRFVNLTCTTKIIEDIAKNIGPKKYFISLGYAGWGPGQLEEEIINNSWIKIKEKLDLIFDIEAEKKWDQAIKLTGIDFSKFSSFSGNA